MANHQSELEVVLINEIKQQVARNNTPGINFRKPKIAPGCEPPGSIVHPAWSKYPCPIESSCSDRFCHGEISIIISVDNIKWFSRPITLVAIHRKKKTYILYDRKFRKLLDNKVITNYKTKNVQY